MDKPDLGHHENNQYFSNPPDSADLYSELNPTCIGNDFRLNNSEEPTGWEDDLDFQETLDLLETDNLANEEKAPYVETNQASIEKDFTQENRNSNDERVPSDHENKSVDWQKESVKEIDHNEDLPKYLISNGFDALKKSDYNLCWSICQVIMRRKCSSGWKLCIILANCDLFTNLYAKLELLSFAILNCDNDALSYAMIGAIKRVKIEILRHSAQQLDRGDVSELPSLSSFLPPIGSTTKLVKSLMNFRETKSDFISNDYLAKSEPKQAGISYDAFYFNPFYSDVFRRDEKYDIKANNLDYNYKSFDISLYDKANLALSQVQLKLRIEMLKEQINQPKVISILQELSFIYLTCDTALSLGCILSLNDHSEELPFSRIEHPPPFLIYLALYFYSLVFCLRRDAISDVQTVPCENVISRAQLILREERYLVEKYHRKYSNLIQFQDILSIEPSIDVDRLVDDQEYREASLLGLAMTDDEPTFLRVVTLAQQFKLSLWDVYVTYLEYLLTNVNYDVEIVANRVFKQQFIDVLADKPKDLENYFEKRIFPLIPNDDHNRRVLCYQIIEKVCCMSSSRDDGEDSDI